MSLDHDARITALPADTALEAAQVQVEVLRRISPRDRATMVFEMSSAMREIAAAGVRARHPEYSERMAWLATVKLALGEELFREAYGVDVEP